MSGSILSIIAAVAKNGVIGADGKLPWRIPADLKRFKQLTTGHTLVMGRKTYESIGRPLPDRYTVVVSRDPSFSIQKDSEIATVRSLDEAIRIALHVEEFGFWFSRYGVKGEAFVCGGGEVYRQTISLASRLYLTLVEREYEGDARFPQADILNGPWECTATYENAVHDPPYRFVDFRRKEGGR